MNDTDEEIEFNCPCCHSLIAIDDAGDFYLKKQHLEADENAGLGGLTVVEASPNWKEQSYKFNSQIEKHVPTFIAGSTVTIDESKPLTDADHQLLNELALDLKKLGFVPTPMSSVTSDLTKSTNSNDTNNDEN